VEPVVWSPPAAAPAPAPAQSQGLTMLTYGAVGLALGAVFATIIAKR
jgi:hypothetical protein